MSTPNPFLVGATAGIQTFLTGADPLQAPAAPMGPALLPPPSGVSGGWRWSTFALLGLAAFLFFRSPRSPKRRPRHARSHR